MEATIRHLNATMPDLLPGYRVKIIDGNAIASSEYRLKVLRDISQLLKARRVKVCLKQPNRHGAYRGMMIAIPPDEWCVFQNMTFTE
ncbi:hypothetical protein FD723_07720 [Nostoc sp. C052]|uniref:hypothetical protein n=1 Tax=Nostoc sp. C052 TaxID=2576902 RepID=UPI0015C33FEA|nr:hypothetical protein [Nostoc sp. C052]QLE40354.1 hypothetical protein FD723_07720 [Nostoc sp. C052]